MRVGIPAGAVMTTLASITLLAAFQASGKPEAEFAAIVRTWLGNGFGTDWEELEKLPGIRWAPLPATSLKNCLPDGGCYTRQGIATLGGRSVNVIATGARTMALQLYFRNPSAPIGEAAVLETLKQAALSPELARCPVRSGAGGTNWYRVKGDSVTSGFLSIQTSCNGRPCEGFVLYRSERLPPLQPNQLELYSEQCAAGAVRAPVSTSKPHERLAEVITALLGQASGPALYDWKTLSGLPIGITWDSAGPKPANLVALKNDANPLMQSGSVTYAGREFSLMASGTPEQVKVIYLDEVGRHPRGEHMLGVVYQKGIAVQLVRCGPVYTESTNNWYRLSSARTRPAMVRQSIGYDGNLVSDSYALRLDGSLPPRDPRDRDPGVNGCR
jgi:hypothetical protein